jgi:hypothetical protein
MKEEPVKTVDYRGYKIRIYPDTDPMPPDDWGDNNLFLAHYHRDCWITGPKNKNKSLVCTEKILGYIYTKNADDYDQSGAEALLATHHVFAVAAYIHSGVFLSLDGGEFPDQRWDVSHVGAVFAAKSEFPDRDKARICAEGLVQSWNEYLSGAVYGFCAGDDDDESCIASCCGFSGDYDTSGLLDEAKGSIDYYIADRLKKHTAHVKALLKAKAPLFAFEQVTRLPYTALSSRP